MSTHSFFISGIRCYGCVSKIEKSLEKLEYIKEFSCNFTQKKISITYIDINHDALYYENLTKNLHSLGFELIENNVNEEHSKELKHLLKYIACSFAAVVNLMIISFILWLHPDLDPVTRSLWQYFSAIASVPFLMIGSTPFVRSFIQALMTKNVNMDVPIFLAIYLAMIVSMYQTFTNGAHVYFDSVSMLCFILLLGRYANEKVKYNVINVGAMFGANRSQLYKIIEKDENLGKNNMISILAKDIKENMHIIIEKGAVIPTDGYVLEGASNINNASITGESDLQPVCKNDLLLAGAVNTGQVITMFASKDYKNNSMSEIQRLIDTASESKTKYLNLSNYFAKLYTPIVHIIAILCFLYGLIFLNDIEQTIFNSISVLIIACPCALGLAVPMVHIAAIGRLFRENIITKSGDAIEKMTKISQVFFDKTGTLTEISKEIHYGKNITLQTKEMLYFMTSQTIHPLSISIYNDLKNEIKTVENNSWSCHEIENCGIELQINLENHTSNTVARIGKLSWILEKIEARSENNTDLHFDSSYKTELEKLDFYIDILNQNIVQNSVSSSLLKIIQDKLALIPNILYFYDGKEICRIYIEQILKCGTKELVKYFDSQTLPISILSGDNKDAVEKIAQELNIKNFKFSLTPKEKYEIIQKNPDSLIVGDGTNDALAMCASTLSISHSQATGIAQTSSDVILLRNNLQDIILFHKIAKKAVMLIRQNFYFTMVYNSIVIPLAFFGYVNPLIAAISMSLSSIIVCGNALRIKKGCKE